MKRKKEEDEDKGQEGGEIRNHGVWTLDLDNDVRIENLDQPSFSPRTSGKLHKIFSKSPLATEWRVSVREIRMEAGR